MSCTQPQRPGGRFARTAKWSGCCGGAGNVIAAIDLETLWNELATEVPFSLYCAYRSESVAGPEHAAMLHRVCQLHSAVVPAPPVEATWRFASDVAAAGDARRLLTETLRQAGHHADLIRDAQFVIGELAANAVRHVCTPFSVSVRSTDSTVGIRVRDESQDLPKVRAASSTMPSGRGMHIISALATRWGADLTADGKVVWVELGADWSVGAA